MARVARQSMIVHPGRVGVAASPPQEHDHAAEFTTAADPAPDHAPLLPAPVSCHHLARLPCVLTGLLTGHTRLACVRASLLCATVSWQRCCDFFRRARWSRSAFLAATTALVLRSLYPDGLPARLWWVVDTTTSDKPSARQVFGIRTCWRGCRRPGQTRTHQGHGWLAAGPPPPAGRRLLAGAADRRPLVAPVALCPAGPLDQRAGRPTPAAAASLPCRRQRPRAQRLPGVRWLRAQGCHSVTRLSRNTVVYTPAEAPAVRGRGRPRTVRDDVPGRRPRPQPADRAGGHRLGEWALAAGDHLARDLLAQRLAGEGDARHRRDGAPRAMVPPSDRPDADDRRDRGRLSRSSRDRAGDPGSECARAGPVSWADGAGSAALAAADLSGPQPAGLAGAGGAGAAAADAGLAAGIRERTRSANCVAGCWRRWRRRGFSCPKAGWATPCRKSCRYDHLADGPPNG